jgi:hypothetical protein
LDDRAVFDETIDLGFRVAVFGLYLPCVFAEPEIRPANAWLSSQRLTPKTGIPGAIVQQPMCL